MNIEEKIKSLDFIVKYSSEWLEPLRLDKETTKEIMDYIAKLKEENKKLEQNNKNLEWKLNNYECIEIKCPYCKKIYGYGFHDLTDLSRGEFNE